MTDKVATESTTEAGGEGFLPISERRIKQAFYLVLFLWIGGLMVMGLQWSFRDRLVPFIVGIPMLALVVLQFLPVDWNDLVDRVIPASFQPDEAESGPERLLDRCDDNVGYGEAKQQRVAAVLIGWCVALVVLVYLFGYYFVLPPYVFAFYWYFYRDIRKAAIYALGFTVAVTLLFVVLFNVTLYSGALGLPNPTYLL